MKIVSDVHMYSSILSIKKVTTEDSGTYEVVATNREGEATNIITLEVEPKKRPPEIIEPLKDTNVKPKETLKLVTTIKANPPPSITWLKNGKPLRPSRTMKTSSDKDIHTLTIDEVKPEDAGKYDVKAENPLGIVSTSATVTVLGNIFVFVDFNINWT